MMLRRGGRVHARDWGSTDTHENKGGWSVEHFSALDHYALEATIHLFTKKQGNK